MESKIQNDPLVKKWLKFKRSANTRNTYISRITKVLEYFKMTPDELLALSPREARDLALTYQNENPQLSNNTVLGRITAIGSFMDHYDKTISWKRNMKVRPRPDVTSHVFSNGDLSRMFAVGDSRDKAILSLACSLGWEISSVVDLKRETLRRLLERQEETREQFVFFKQIREKTGQPRLAVLNPLAIKCCRKWLKETERLDFKIKDSANPISDIFNYTGRGLLNRMKILAKRAGIKPTGSVKFHNIRKWVMSGLSRSGFNEWQTKFLMGKSIPLSDQTYLQTLEIEIRERYPEAYENYLNLSTTISRDMKKKTVEIEGENRKLKEKLAKMEVNMAKTDGKLAQIESLLAQMLNGKA